MSTRVLNPAASLMTELSRISSSTPPTSIGSSVGGRVQPSRAALAKVRRDLFGPVDHVAARTLAEQELEAQSILDTERWGFDFRLELPKNSSTSRFEWEIITANDHVPEPYALRGMPYIKRHASLTPRKSMSMRSPRIIRISSESPTMTIPTPIKDIQKTIIESERTPPQENRNVTLTIETTPEVVPAIAELSFRSSSKTQSSTKKQAVITDFMKSRKRAISGTPKSVTGSPPAKSSRR